MLKLEALNNAQRKAVMHGEGPLLVLAGPGSGKTLTITQRIRYLIETMQVSPDEILVITFTKEAALSMQRRFQEQSEQVYPVNFGTFHSVFFHILNQSQGSNHSRKKQILRESQKKRLLYPIVRKYRNYQENKEFCAEDITSIISAISFYKNTGDMEETLRKLAKEWQGIFQTIYEEYESVRIRENAIDFDDMVYECADLLEKDVQQRNYWQRRFAHILIDEFQDINPMQFRVIRLLTRPPYNLFAVGDDDQAIYGFRGSKPACMKQFEKEYHAEKVLLDINYRSGKEIIEASLSVIAENKDRFQKKLVSSDAQQYLPEERNVSIKTFQEREEEYQYLINYFAAKREQDTYAVLFRTNAYMQGFAIRLQREGISFVMKEKRESIYENTIVQDIMAYLRVASGEEKRELWLRILNKPSRFISREALAEENSGINTSTKTDMGREDTPSLLYRIKSYYEGIHTDSYSFLYWDKIRGAINILEKQLRYLKKASPFLGVQYIRKVIGYDKYIKEFFHGKQDGEKRYTEAVEILEWLTEDAKRYTSLEEWRNAQEKYQKSLLEKANTSASSIHLMTIHASKGLEFDRVWIPDCNEKVFPHGTMLEKEACEEERRIFYVGMTRAKKSLELLCTTGTKERPRLISRFLNPLWKDYYSSSFTTSSNSH